MASPSVTQSLAVTTLVTTAETAAVTSGPLPVNAPAGQGILVQGTVSGATGAGVTSCQVRVRKGAGAGGALVGAVLQEAQGASSFYSMSFSVLDDSLGVPSAPSGTAEYTVTVQQVGATGNGTVTIANVSAEPANAAGA